MVFLAAAEILTIFTGIILLIWRLQFIFPEFGFILLGILVLTLLVHRDGWQNLGFGSHGFVSGMKALFAPTMILSMGFVLGGMAFGAFRGHHLILNWTMLSGFSRYFAWCLFQQFGLQSFFTNRIIQVLKNSRRTAWTSGAIFAAFHIPNPVLMPLTFFGGVILTRVFIRHRNLVPLALAQAVIGTLTSITIPPCWHHGLRVGPGYYQ